MSGPLCRFVIVAEDMSLVPAGAESKLIIVQPVVNFLVPFVPTQISLSVVASVSELQPGQAYSCAIRINSPEGETITEQSWQIQEVQLPNTTVKPSANMAGNIKNMIVESEGEYRITLHHGDKVIGEQTFNVIRQEVKK